MSRETSWASGGAGSRFARSVGNPANWMGGFTQSRGFASPSHPGFAKVRQGTQTGPGGRQGRGVGGTIDNAPELLGDSLSLQRRSINGGIVPMQPAPD